MKPLLRRLQRTYQSEVRVAERLQPGLLMVVRMFWGWQFFLTGRGKLLHIEQTSAFFESLGVPVPMLNAYAVGTVECFGGLLLLLGLLSRIVTIPLILTLCGAYLTADYAALRSIIADPNSFVTADPFLFLFATILVLLFGPGWLALDSILGRRCEILQDASVIPPLPHGLKY